MPIIVFSNNIQPDTFTIYSCTEYDMLCVKEKIGDYLISYDLM